MILVIGGYSQGKLEYVKSKYNISDEDIYDFEKSDDLKLENNLKEIISDKQIVFNNVNYLIKNVIEDKNIDIIFERLIHNYPNAIIITDEVGNGVVPIDKNERLLRETIGRMQCKMAENANEVIRVVCGIGQRIK